MVALMWMSEVVDIVSGLQLDRYGIEPREPGGLVGIVAAPFLHVGFGHVAANTVPFLLLGFLIALGGALRVVLVTAIVALVGGLGTWLLAPAASLHVGASGVVFGYAGYVLSRGFSAGAYVTSPSLASSPSSGAAPCSAACCPRQGSRGRATSSGAWAGSRPVACSSARADAGRKRPDALGRSAAESPSPAGSSGASVDRGVASALRRDIATLGFSVDHEQGDLKRGREVEGRELSHGRLDERQIPSCKGIAQPSVLGALIDMNVFALRETRLGRRRALDIDLCEEADLDECPERRRHRPRSRG